jgi:hypothetical protein
VVDLQGEQPIGKERPVFGFRSFRFGPGGECRQHDPFSLAIEECPAPQSSIAKSPASAISRWPRWWQTLWKTRMEPSSAPTATATRGRPMISTGTAWRGPTWSANRIAVHPSVSTEPRSARAQSGDVQATRRQAPGLGDRARHGSLFLD